MALRIQESYKHRNKQNLEQPVSQQPSGCEDRDALIRNNYTAMEWNDCCTQWDWNWETLLTRKSLRLCDSISVKFPKQHIKCHLGRATRRKGKPWLWDSRNLPSQIEEAASDRVYLRACVLAFLRARLRMSLRESACGVGSWYPSNSHFLFGWWLLGDFISSH